MKRRSQKALLLGINHFDEESFIPNLTCTTSDVKCLRECLHKYLGFKDEEIIVLTTDNEKLSKFNILHQFLSRDYLGSPQFLLVYMSTHGILNIEKQQAYLIPSDVRCNKRRNMEPEIIKKTAISSGEFMDSIQAIGAQQTLLVFDVCHSGAFGQLKGLNDGEGEEEMNKWRGFDSLQYFSSNVGGIGIISSCKKDKVSFGFKDGSIFTKYLIKCLMALSKEEDGILLLRLVELLQLEMEESPQTPIFKCDNIQNSHKWFIGLPNDSKQRKKTSRSWIKNFNALNIVVNGKQPPKKTSKTQRRSKTSRIERRNSREEKYDNTPSIIPTEPMLEISSEINIKSDKPTRKLTPERRKRDPEDDESEKIRKRNKPNTIPSSPQGTDTPITQEKEEPIKLEDESSSTPIEAYISTPYNSTMSYKKDEATTQDFSTLMRKSIEIPEDELESILIHSGSQKKKSPDSQNDSSPVKNEMELFLEFICCHSNHVVIHKNDGPSVKKCLDCKWEGIDIRKEKCK